MVDTVHKWYDRTQNKYRYVTGDLKGYRNEEPNRGCHRCVKMKRIPSAEKATDI